MPTGEGVRFLVAKLAIRYAGQEEQGPGAAKARQIIQESSSVKTHAQCKGLFGHDEWNAFFPGTPNRHLHLVCGR